MDKGLKSPPMPLQPIPTGRHPNWGFGMPLSLIAWLPG